MDLTTLLLGMHTEDEVRNNYVRAPIGYPGAKSRSINELLKHLPYREVWVDVCGGTGSVTLARNSSRLEVYNDRHSGLVALYRCIRDREKCQQLIDRIDIAPPTSKEEFLWSRDTWIQPHLDDVERAARWYYSLVHSFNSKGWVFGRTVKGNNQGMKLYNNLKLFWPVHTRLRNVQIENADWRMILKDYSKSGKDVVWYIDPPYWRTSGIYEFSWKEGDHYELCERIQSLNGGFVAVSGYDHVNHPYNKFKFWTKKVSWEVHVSMTGLAFTESNNLDEHEENIKRGSATETLWIYDPS